jgi:RNA polymerase sigma factor (sigma-70 family)
MAAEPNALLRYVHRLVRRPREDKASDTSLLEQFISAGDERAFAALVERHGPMVLHVCRRVLGNDHDAEDAFQATFLVLARRATALIRREALPAWLHGVAHRVALRARVARMRRLPDTGAVAVPRVDPHPDPLAELSARELLLIVDEEVRRLPEVYRLPVLLCCLEGHSLEEAARQLGWTTGSVKGRLERGRARLHQRLLRRGLTLSAVLTAMEVSRGSAAALVTLLADRLIPVAVAFARCPTAVHGGISAGTALLATETLRHMTRAPLKLTSALLLAGSLLATGFALQRVEHAPPPHRVLSAGTDERAAPAAGGDEQGTPIQVSGRVLDPRGQPLAGARLYVGYCVRRFTPALEIRHQAYPLRGTSREDGRFQFTFNTGELDAQWLDDSRPAVLAVADGYGPDWVQLGESAEGSGLSLKLVEDLPLVGRILDRDRRPVAGTTILVQNVISDTRDGVSRFLRREVKIWPPPGSWRGPIPGQAPTLRTDAEGRFRLQGLGRDRIVVLALAGETLQHAGFEAVVRPSAAMPYLGKKLGDPFEVMAAPARPIRGLVRDQLTGVPIEGARVSVLFHDAGALTDAVGHFEVLGCSQREQSYFVTVQPPLDQPYLAASTWASAPAGAEPFSVKFDLVRGLWLSGRVTEEATQVPPRVARVEYHPLPATSRRARLTNGFTQAASSAVIRPDGSYRLAVLPGPGVICVAASPGDAYAAAVVDPDAWAKRFDGEFPPGGTGFLCIDKYNVLTPINPSETETALTLDLQVERAVSRPGMVVGPDHQPLAGVRVRGLSALPDDEILQAASFTVRGLNPRGSRALFFHHRDRGLGKMLTIRGEETGPLTVQLDPCGSVAGRLLDARGQPVAEVKVFSLRMGDGPEVLAETDRDGRFRGALVPGPKYTLGLAETRRLATDVGEVEVESGRTRDLGDLLLGD